MFEKQLSYSENLFFNGVYQLTKVESRVNQGAFTQVLTLVRLNNQKGTGDSGFFIEDESFTKIFKDKKAAEKAAADKVIEDALETFTGPLVP